MRLEKRLTQRHGIEINHQHAPFPRAQEAPVPRDSPGEDLVPDVQHGWFFAVRARGFVKRPTRHT